MGKMILSWQNWIDQAGVTFTTDSSSANLPASSLADAVIAKPWRTSGATSAYVEIDLTTARSIGFLIGAGLTLASGDTIRVRLGTSAGAGDLLDQSAAGTIDGNYLQWVYVLSSAVAAQHLRLDITATSRAAQGYFDFGRLWVGTTWQPTYDREFGASEQWKDHSSDRRGERSGVAFPLNTWQQRIAAFSLGALTETEAKDDLREMARVTGIREQIAFIPDPDSSWIAQEAILGRMRDSTPIRHPEFGIRTKVFEIHEDK